MSPGVLVLRTTESVQSPLKNPACKLYESSPYPLLPQKTVEEFIDGLQPGCFGEGVLGVGMDGDEAVGHAEELVNRSCGCDAARTPSTSRGSLHQRNRRYLLPEGCRHGGADHRQDARRVTNQALLHGPDRLHGVVQSPSRPVPHDRSWHIPCTTSLDFPSPRHRFLQRSAVATAEDGLGVERFETDGQNADDNDRGTCSSRFARAGFTDLTSIGGDPGKNYKCERRHPCGVFGIPCPFSRSSGIIGSAVMAQAPPKSAVYSERYARAPAGLAGCRL